MSRSVWDNPPRGFRMMRWDPVAALLCAALTWWSWRWLGAWALIAPYALGHFFLFCNVFRVRRRDELVWAAVFVLSAALWVQVTTSVWPVLLTPLPLTAVILIATARSPQYRGAWCQRLSGGQETTSRG